jgi:tetratricopeptide (TPR) repeat protein
MEMRVRAAVQLGITVVTTLVLTAPICSGQAAGVPAKERDTAFGLEQQGKFSEAEAAWRTLVKAQPTDAEAYAHLGFLEARQERYKEAIPLYHQALKLNPSMPGLRLNYGLALFKAGELKQAIQTFEQLLKSEPPSSPDTQRVTTLIGIAHYGLGEYSAAIPYLKQATAGDPQNLPFRLLLAQSCLTSQQYQCVLDVYHEILTLNAESAEADMLAGEAMDAMRDHDGAIEQFRAAVKADPKAPNVHFGLGYLLWAQMQYEGAAESFQAELTNDPDNVQSLAYLADANIRMNHPEAARPLLEKAVKIDPKNELVHLDLGILDSDAGRREEALVELKQAAKLRPDDANVHFRLARLYKAMGKNEEAKAEFDTTSELHKAANATVFDELHKAQTKGKPTDGSSETPDK